MDKWDAIVNRIKQGMLAEEPEAALAGGLELLAEFGRTLDRIADALVKDIGYVEQPPQHDL